MNLLEKIFKLKENNTTFRREVYTGTIIFLTISYILAVNPSILSSTGMPKGGLFYATALAAFVGTFAMAIIANCPLALAPAMGLNAFFAYSIVGTMGYSWQFALAAVVFEGIIFFLLSVSSIREKIIYAIPLPLKYAMGAGVGLFITLIAFKNSCIIKDHPATLLTIQDFFGPDFHTAGISAILAIGGVLLSSFLLYRNIAAALLFGILATWAAGIICQVTGVYHVDPANGFYSLIPNLETGSFSESFKEFTSLFASAFDVSKWECRTSKISGLNLIFSVDFTVICFSLLFTDFFDTVGTVNGAIVNTPLMKEDGSVPRLKRIMVADSIATFAGGVLGTSTTTTFAESAVGIRAGARTGVSALTCALWFLVSIVCAPLFLAIPGFATAPALIIVGFLMLKSVFHIDWDDITGAIPAYLLITGIVFTYNISDGLGLGIISYTILNIGIKGRVNWLLVVISLMFIAKYLFL
ncbi:MAG: NCS2 family permease [Lentisphaeria bacterium]|nr:NCS2 family permease [Lentisphaeria bacterium]